MIAIIGAMQEEVDALKSLMEVIKEEKTLEFNFYIGTIGQNEVILMQSGIGKVNAALSTTLLLKSYSIEFIINIGSAGGLKQTQKQGDLMISTSVIHHDVEATGFGYQIGQIPGMPLDYPSNELLLKQTTKIIEELKFKSQIGLIVSGDQFIAKKEQFENIINNFPEALCVDMEAASIAQVAYQFKIPYIIIRSLSDVYNSGNQHLQFNEYIKLASRNSALLCSKLVNSLIFGGYEVEI